MKTQYFLLFFLCTQCLLLGCTNHSENKNDAGAVEDISEKKALAKQFFDYDKYAEIYQFTSSNTDGILACEQWFLHDSVVKKTATIMAPCLCKANM